MRRVTRRRFATAVAAALLLAGIALSLGPPRFTWVNTGVRIDYAWRHPAGALAASGALFLLASLASRGRLKAACGALAAGVAGFGLHLLVYRVEAGQAAIARRGLLGTSTIPWRDVSRVESGDAVVVVWGKDDRQIRVPTTSFAGEQRAAFDRTIARRVREGAAR
jgi:hypothetical protein